MTLVAEAVFARALSALKEERVAAEKVLAGPEPSFDGDRLTFQEDIRQAMYASKIVSYAQGYQLMRAAAKTYGWNLKTHAAVLGMVSALLITGTLAWFFVDFTRGLW